MMVRFWTGVFAVFFLVAVALTSGAKKGGKSLVETVSDHKDFKKLLRTKNNILVAFVFGSNNAGLPKTLDEVSEAIKGIGTVVTVDCTDSNAKKLCKKLKVTSRVIKHYKDGDFHLNYDRQERTSSMVRFMKDPSGDLPWDEDSKSVDVIHINDQGQFNKLLKKEKNKGLLVMFYAPWCGFCKRMKPDYQEAATTLKQKGMDDKLIVAVDVTKPDNSPLSKKYNITGFPTLLYFESGALAYPYPGDNKKDAIVAFLADPKEEAPEKEKEAQWKDEPSEVVHLTDDTFDDFLASEPSVLVMFYAPWCGHCKRMKPQFDAAAAKLKEEGVTGKLAAVDCTQENKIGKRFEVKGYPTVNYFKDGELAFKAGHVREEKEIVKFMKDPSEPPPPPPPETPWSEEENEVHHLNEEEFKPFLKKKKHVLVFFYAPWCGHCKKAKPEIAAAASVFSENPQVEFAAVDCTLERSLCSYYDVSGYPTMKYFRYFNKEPVRDYDGGRTKEDFVSFMNDPDDPRAGKAPPPPSAKEQWADHIGAEHVLHLEEGTFDSDLAGKDHALVAFYAPWCGHCKAMKADYAAAASELISSPNLAIAAVDATAHQKLGQRFEIRGYPTIKYFKNGKPSDEYNGGRSKADFVKFLRAKNKDEL